MVTKHELAIPRIKVHGWSIKSNRGFDQLSIIESRNKKHFALLAFERDDGSPLVVTSLCNARIKNPKFIGVLFNHHPTPITINHSHDFCQRCKGEFRERYLLGIPWTENRIVTHIFPEAYLGQPVHERFQCSPYRIGNGPYRGITGRSHELSRNRLKYSRCQVKPR